MYLAWTMHLLIFVTVLQDALDNVSGFKYITMRDKDPPYITPAIRILLRKRDKLTRRGQITQADLLSKKIGKAIERARANSLKKANASDTRQLWQVLRTSRNWSGKKRSNSSFNLSPDFNPTANDLNSYYAGVSTDPLYSQSAVADALSTPSVPGSQSVGISSNFVPYTPDHIAVILSRIKPSSPGPDGIPYWLYKTCAPQLSAIVAKLVNYSLTKSVAPRVWKTAHITPVPKCSPVAVPSDLRPISVTSILSRTVERLIVRDYITPLLMSSMTSTLTFHHMCTD